MNVKHITGVTTMCALFAASMYAESYKHGVMVGYNKEAEKTKTITDDTIKTKGYQDKAYIEASMKIDSTNNKSDFINHVNRLFLEDAYDVEDYIDVKKDAEEHSQLLNEDYDDEENDFLYRRFH